jgi:hypothetical protein
MTVGIAVPAAGEGARRSTVDLAGVCGRSRRASTLVGQGVGGRAAPGITDGLQSSVMKHSE